MTAHVLNGGVIIWNQRLLVYTHRESGWHAQYLGDDQPLAIVPELHAAIEADQRHQQEKRVDDAGA